MNFTFTWILDKFGLQPKVEITPVKKPARKKVATKKVAVKKASVKKKA
jgi:hypothetical protein